MAGFPADDMLLGILEAEAAMDGRVPCPTTRPGRKITTGSLSRM